MLQISACQGQGHFAPGAMRLEKRGGKLQGGTAVLATAPGLAAVLNAVSNVRYRLHHALPFVAFVNHAAELQLPDSGEPDATPHAPQLCTIAIARNAKPAIGPEDVYLEDFIVLGIQPNDMG